MNHPYDPGHGGDDFAVVLAVVCFWALLIAAVVNLFG